MIGQVLLFLVVHQQPSLERCHCQAHKLLCMVQSHFFGFLVVCILYVCYILLHHICGLECLFCSCSPCSQLKYSVRPQSLLFVAMSIGYSSFETNHAICNMNNNKHTFCIMLKVKVNFFESQISSFKVVFLLQFLEPIIFKSQSN